MAVTTAPLALPRAGTLSRYGWVALFASALLFAVMGVCVKLLTSGLPPAERLPELEVAFVRFAFGLLAVLGMAAAGRARLRTERPVPLILRGIFGTLAISLFFTSITHSQLTKGTLLTYTYLIFAPLFSALWLRERPTWVALGALLVSAAGILLVVRPDVRHINLGDVAGLGSGILSGLAITTIRDLRRTESAPIIFFSLCLCGTLVLGVLLALAAVGPLASLGRPRLPGGTAMLLLLGVGVTSTAGQLILTWGFRYTSTSLGSLISVTVVPISAVAGILLFGETLHWQTVAGAALVLAAGVFLSLAEGSLKKTAALTPPE
jgi:drug/metabolite transporter (DMT)-like permease